MKNRSPFRSAACLVALTLLGGLPLQAWDYAGHRLVNQLALAGLPADFPAFVREADNAERIAFLSGEPDRWRNVPDLIMKQSGGSWTDHFIDMEQIPLAGLRVDELPSFRYDFILQFATGRLTHPKNFKAIDPAKNSDHTSEWPGFSPWAIAEWYTKLRSGFSYLKAFEENGGTPEEIANAKANIVYAMGIIGHYVADGAQPLHTTVHHNGWDGENPQGYTTWSGFHSWIDGGFVAKAGIITQTLLPRVAPGQPISLAARTDGREPLFVAVLDYLVVQNQNVEPLYRLEKEGKLSDDLEKTGKFGQDTKPVNAEGRAFIEGQLLAGGHMLSSIWITAWRGAVPDTYLRSQLMKRQTPAKPAAATP
jgi:hypothetical protein